MLDNLVWISICAPAVVLVLNLLPKRTRPSLHFGIGVVFVFVGGLLLFGLVPQQMRKGELSQEASNIISGVEELKKELDGRAEQNKQAGGGDRGEPDRELLEEQVRTGQQLDEARDLLIQVEKTEGKARAMSGCYLIIFGLFAVAEGWQRKKLIAAAEAVMEKGLA